MLFALQGATEKLGGLQGDWDVLVKHLVSVHHSAEMQINAAPRHFFSCAELFESTILKQHHQLLQQQTFLKVCLCDALC